MPLLDSVLASVMLVVATILPILAARRAQFLVLNPMTLLFIQIFMGFTLKGFLLIWFPSLSAELKYWFVADAVLPTVLYVMLFVGLVVVSYSFSGVRYNRSELLNAISKSEKKAANYKMTLLLSIGVVVVTLGVLISQKGVIGGLTDVFNREDFENLQRYRSIYIDRGVGFGATFAATAVFLKFGYFLFIYFLLKSRFSEFESKKTIVIGLVICMLLLFLEIVFTGRRTFLLAYFLTAIGIYALPMRRLNFSLNLKKIIGIVVGLVLIFIVFNVISNARGGTDESVLSSLLGIIYGEYFISFSKMTVFVSEFAHHEPLYGKSYTDWTFGFIPRVFWENKPALSLGPYIMENYYRNIYTISGVPPTFIGEGLLNFGWFGLAVAPLYGFLLRKFEISLLNPRRVIRNDSHLWYFTLLFPVSYNMYQSSFSPSVINTVTQAGLLFVFLLVLNRKPLANYR